MTRYRFLSDEPLDESFNKVAQSGTHAAGLGFDGYAHLLATHATSVRGPFTIGIDAAWGRGKTTLLRAIERHLKELELPDAQTIIPVRFNAWQFENETNILAPLLLTIASELQSHMKQHKKQKMLGKAVEGCLTILAAIESGITLHVPGVDMKPGDMLAYAKKAAAGEDLVEYTPYYRGFVFLHDACKQLSKNTVIALFIDDLDRCSPEKALKVLEHIKLVLSQPGFVFFLAADNDTLERYIAQQYQKTSGSYADAQDPRDYSRKYFEKLIQVSFAIPQAMPAGDDGYDAFLDNLLDRMRAEPADPLRKLKAIFGAPLDYNPRRCIKTLNTITLITSLLGELRTHASVYLKLLTVEVIMSLCFKDFYKTWIDLSQDEREVFLKNLSEQKNTSNVKQNLGRAATAQSTDSPSEVDDLWRLVAVNRPLRNLLWHNAPEVNDALQAWLSAEPSQPPLEKIRYLVSSQRLTETYQADSTAAQEYNKTLASDPDNVQALTLRAEAYERAGEVRKAQVDRQRIDQIAATRSGMIKLDNNLINEMKLGELGTPQKRQLLSGMYKTLEQRVGISLAKQMTDQQLIDFEDFTNENDESAALDWLEDNFPEYRITVRAEFEKLKEEIRAKADKIREKPEAINEIIKDWGGTEPIKNS